MPCHACATSCALRGAQAIMWAQYPAPSARPKPRTSCLHSLSISTAEPGPHSPTCSSRCALGFKVTRYLAPCLSAKPP